MTYDNPQQLLERAQKLAGFTLSELAENYRESVPAHLLNKKGWIGQFIEWILGAQSGSLAQPDFPEIGVELKTLPIDYNGKPLESTFVSVLPLKNIHGIRWENSVVRHKLAHVLWIPIVSDPELPIDERQVGMPFLWRPDQQQELQLQQDFDAVLERVSLGEIDRIDARFGEILQVRPKAANSKALTEAIGPNGESIMTLPRGFYLRPNFTKLLINRAFE